MGCHAAAAMAGTQETELQPFSFELVSASWLSSAPPSTIYVAVLAAAVFPPAAAGMAGTLETELQPFSFELVSECFDSRGCDIMAVMQCAMTSLVCSTGRQAGV
jgi:hypothetical protein